MRDLQGYTGGHFCFCTPLGLGSQELSPGVLRLLGVPPAVSIVGGSEPRQGPAPLWPSYSSPSPSSWGSLKVLGEGQDCSNPSTAQGTGVGRPRTWGLSALGAAGSSVRWGFPLGLKLSEAGADLALLGGRGSVVQGGGLTG